MDQPQPIPNNSRAIVDIVIEDMQAISRYGTPPQAHNGRDALQDAYEEALNLCLYLKQAIKERDDHLALVDRISAAFVA